MEYRSLGRTGVQVSTVCLGCMMFGRRTEEADSMDMIDRAIDGGINFLDTANVYSRGRSEEITGKALKRNGKRSRIVLATKVHGRMDDEDINAAGSSRRHIIEQCEQSLKRLQTDWPHPIAFLLGSDLGLDDGVRAAAREQLSLGPLTLAHELARLVLYEQIYRGFCITAGIKYHRDPL